jgi:hypothetical protein
MHYDKDDDSGFAWIFGGMPIVLGLVLLLVTNAPPKPLSLKNKVAFGCYSAELAPPIRLDSSGMHILQPGFPAIPFHLERHKTGIAISADRPIQATAINGRFVYSFYEPGEGWYLDFFNVVNGQRYGVFDEAYLTEFTMLSRDTGKYLTYAIAPPSACANK